MLDNDERLSVVSDVLSIDIGHILSNANLFVVVNEFLIARIGIKINICDLIGALIAPVCNDT